MDNIYTIQCTTKMHISKMWFIIYYYSHTCFGRLCDHLQGDTKDHTMYR